MYQAILSSVPRDQHVNRLSSSGLTNEEIEKSILDDDDEGFVTEVDPDFDLVEDGSGGMRRKSHQSLGSHSVSDILSDSISDSGLFDDDDKMFILKNVCILLHLLLCHDGGLT